MRKHFKCILLLSVCGLLCILLLGACNSKNTTMCSHSWTENYIEDGDRHYQVCSECSERLYGEHSYVNGYCVCGKAYQDQNQHSHSWTENYIEDGDRHYQVCSECLERLYGEHSYVNGYCVCGKADCDEQGLIYSKGLSGYVVIAYNGNNTDIEIPQTYKNELVVAIESNVFSNCYKLSSITIPDSIGAIGANAFDRCHGLKAVYITNIALWCSINFETIESNPLYYAHNLCVYGKLVTKLTIPNEICNIAAYAFAGYDKLTDIMIPSSVNTIGEGAFSGCYGIKAVHLTNLESWCSIDFATYSSNPLWYARNLYLKDTLLTDLVIPKGVTAIGSQAFANCNSIITVTISPDVNYVGENAFEDCTSLKAVHIVDLESWCDIEFANFHSNPLQYAHNLYLNDVLVSELVLSDTITSIGAEAFSGCNIISVTIPNSVTFIGARAFSNCDSLQVVKISDISAWCNIQFTYTGSNPLYYAKSLYLNDELITDIIIPYGITQIGAYTFCGGNFTSIEIPDSVISIGDGAFQSCENLISLTIPDSVELLGDSICSYCSKLKYVEIGDKVTCVGEWAFRFCHSLKNVRLGNSMTVIGDYAFDECWSLQDVVLPDSVISIGNNAFSRCNFTNLIIPNSVTNIGAEAFFNCDWLESVKIGSQVVSIGKNAFGLSSTYRSRLTAVYITDIDSWCNIEFESIASNPLYFAHNLYLNDELLTDLNVSDKIIAIKNYAFMNCTSLTSIKLSASVTSIGEYAFSSCNITNIQIPDNITNISNYAFYNCDKLKSIVISQNIVYIGDKALERCGGVKVFFCGTEEEWKNVSNKPKSYYTIYYLSESEPPLNSYGTDYDGQYWHYDNVGNPIVWVYEN